MKKNKKLWMLGIILVSVYFFYTIYLGAQNSYKFGIFLMQTTILKTILLIFPALVLYFTNTFKKNIIALSFIYLLFLVLGLGQNFLLSNNPLSFGILMNFVLFFSALTWIILLGFIKNTKSKSLKFLHITTIIIISYFTICTLIFPLWIQIPKSIYLNMNEITRFEVKWNEIYMNGIMNAQTYKQFVWIIEKNPNIKTLVEWKIPWAIDEDSMLKMSYYVRKKWINTKLLSDSHIASWWVDLFLAWVKRTMEKWAYIWVHSWSDWDKQAKDFPKDSPIHKKDSEYTRKMLWKDDFYWFTIYAASANWIKKMTEDEILKYWLVTEAIINNKKNK